MVVIYINFLYNYGCYNINIIKIEKEEIIMEKYNYKEVRKISLENIRQMCIEHNWYDYGTNKDYDTLLSYSNKDNITSDDIIEMAINMFVHVHLQVKYVHLIKDLIVINLYQNQYILIKRLVLRIQVQQDYIQ